MLKDQRGMTLIEMVVAAVIIGLLAGPIVNLFQKGLELSSKTTEQSTIQMDTQKVLNEIVGGFTYSGVGKLPGVRAATEIITNQAVHALGYQGGDRKIIYYLSDGALYRYVGSSGETLIAGDLTAPTGGSQVLRDVIEFTPGPDGTLTASQLLSIVLETGKGTGIRKVGIRLETNILRRN
ncbi:MAG: prepilin-type N-terminal cleavage/methylation domain-containing protein [Bacillota bacterium]